jgi:hypothetical protein
MAEIEEYLINKNISIQKSKLIDNGLFIEIKNDLDENIIITLVEKFQ